jgi:hypothetical protein
MSETKPIDHVTVMKSNKPETSSSKCKLDNLVFNRLYRAYCNFLYFVFLPLYLLKHLYHIEL